MARRPLRPARLHGPVVPFRQLAHPRRQPGGVGVERGAGRRGLARAVAALEKHDGAHGDLVRCYFSPAQVDTCTPELLREAKRRRRRGEAALSRCTPRSRSVEFNEMLSPPRQDADRLARRARRARAEHRARSRDHRGRLVVDQLPGRRRAHHGGRRLLGGPRGVGVRPARHPDGVVRALQGRRREHVARHRHQSRRA